VLTLKPTPRAGASDGSVPPPPPALEDVKKAPAADTPAEEPAKEAPAADKAEQPPAKEEAPPPPAPLPPGVVRRTELTNQIPANATALRETKVQVRCAHASSAAGMTALPAAAANVWSNLRDSHCARCCTLLPTITHTRAITHTSPAHKHTHHRAQIPEGAAKNFTFAWVCDAKGGLYLSANKDLAISCGNGTIDLAATLNIRGAKKVGERACALTQQQRAACSSVRLMLWGGAATHHLRRPQHAAAPFDPLC
jgi:hypothetical protein